MRLSARNSLKGKIEKVELGAVMASIKIKIEEPGLITALITKESAEALELKTGDDVVAIVKSTEIMVGKE
ncbi:TOBE domain-containing protein [Methanobrevibacter curvatus]|uniref:Molybdenum-pterin-binding protein 2 n=1 Tax=Methanobrevibacter curvatus TaxID=49547 RepID=A0A162FQ36_9EURY|nr:TOBE domain-containing protein [Methanobrevibacter curvatus]KZX13440.1 molybdenum-pterin-binding protein 2 [Methanobrevibacter curvatus]